MDSAIQDLKDKVAASWSEIDNQVDVALSTHLDGKLGNFIQEAYLYASRTRPSIDHHLRNLEVVRFRLSGLLAEPVWALPGECITELASKVNELKPTLY